MNKDSMMKPNMTKEEPAFQDRPLQEKLAIESCRTDQAFERAWIEIQDLRQVTDRLEAKFSSLESKNEEIMEKFLGLNSMVQKVLVEALKTVSPTKK